MVSYLDSGVEAVEIARLYEREDVLHWSQLELIRSQVHELDAHPLNPPLDNLSSMVFGVVYHDDGRGAPSRVSTIEMLH